MPRPFLAVAILLAGVAAPSAASEFRIAWYSIDGGGTSVSAAGSLRLSGSIGQHEPEVVPLCSEDGGPVCVDASLQLTGGFWSGIAAPAANNGISCEGDSDCIFTDGFENSTTGTRP